MKTIETKINRPVIAAFALAAALCAGGSQASTLCSAGSPQPNGLSVNDVTFEGSPADDCYGVIDSGPGGNPTASTVWATTGWTLFAKDESGTSNDISNTVLGIKFTLEASNVGDEPNKLGTWMLSWQKVGEPGYDLTMDVVANLKAADLSASYLFEDLTFTADGSGSGQWEIAFQKQAGPNLITPDLSNMTLWYKDASSTDKPDDPEDPPPGVPEPATVLLMGLGLLGFGASRFKARNI